MSTCIHYVVLVLVSFYLIIVAPFHVDPLNSPLTPISLEVQGHRQITVTIVDSSIEFTTTKSLRLETEGTLRESFESVLGMMDLDSNIYTIKSCERAPSASSASSNEQKREQRAAPISLDTPMAALASVSHIQCQVRQQSFMKQSCFCGCIFVIFW